MRGARVAGGVGLVCALVAGMPHSAPAAVTLVDGDATKPLTLLPLPHGGYAGRLSLALRNEGSTRVTLGVRYLRDDGRQPVVLGRRGSSSASAVMRLVHPRQSLVVAPQAVAQLALRFHLAPGMDASALDGLLVVRASPVTRARPTPDPMPTPRSDPVPAPSDSPSGQADPAPSDPRSGGTDDPDRRTVVRVTSRFGAPPGVGVEPAKLTLRLRENFPLGLSVSGRGAEVTLTGAEAQRLLTGGKRLSGTAVLANDHGDRVSVRWRTEGGDTKVWVDGDPAAGSYSGTLSLLANTAAPVLSLTVKDRHAWIWAFLVVLLGVWIGSYLPVLGALQRRKAVIAATIRQTILDYGEARRRLDVPGEPPTWVDRLIGSDPEPWTCHRWFADPELYHAAGFFSDLYLARDARDLDDSERWAGKIQASVHRWMVLAPALASLRQVAGEEAGLPSIDGRRWQDTSVYRDTLRLMAEGRYEPASDAAMEERLRHIERQHERHDTIAVAWSTIAHARYLGKERRRLVEDLLALATPTADKEPRDEETWNDCLADCERLRRTLATVPRGISVGVAAAGGGTALRHAAEGPRMALFSLPLDLLDRGQAALVGGARAVGGGTSRVVGRIGSALHRVVPGTGSTPAEVVANLRWSDLVFTVVATIIAVVGYTVGIYGDTFGSPTDYAKAFGIGLGTQAVARWLAMPIFDSIRLRRGRPGAETGTLSTSQTAAG